MSVDIVRLLEKIRTSWDHVPSGAQAVTDCIEQITKAGNHGYLGVLYRTDYIVQGRGAFPIDMLRYTSSWPKGEVDARQIEDSIEHGDSNDAFTITLTKYHRDPQPVLSEDRWLSKFRWRVVKTIETVEI